ncbi:MAG: hypothetical protein C0490_11410 [Marivirga sp.]|nr:hypothetical protein [Marivirga sp.]
MKKLTEIPQLISYLIFHWRAMGQLDKLWTSKNYIELISFCNTMLSRNQTDYLAFYYRGLANEELNLFDESVEDFKKSSAALTTYKLASFAKWYVTRIPIQLSRVYRKKQDKEKAFEYADKAVRASTKEIDGLKWRASLKEDFGDNIGALEDLNEALRRKPKDKAILKMRDRLSYIVIQDKRETASR